MSDLLGYMNVYLTFRNKKIEYVYPHLAQISAYYQDLT
jgi:hypothetical protein